MTQPPPWPGWQPPPYPPQAYPPPPGYPPQAYPPPGYPPPGQFTLPPVSPQPGIIPLRPLTLGDIFNGAVRYVRVNPKATLGLAAVVVIVTQVIALLLQVGPLAAMGELEALRGEGDSTAGLVSTIATTLVAALMQALTTVILSGMLTVVIGRAVFGSSITIGQTWARIRGRIGTLLGLALLELLVALVLVGAITLVIVILAVSADVVVAVLAGVLLGAVGLLALLYLVTVVCFAPVAVVLERLPVIASLQRSFQLVRHDFLRVCGIGLLTSIVVGVISTAVAMPFALVQLFVGLDTTSGVLIGTVAASIGSIVGQVITAPFTAGVFVLLYADRRMRAEAFDLVLRTGATGNPADTASTDNLWMVRR